MHDPRRLLTLRAVAAHGSFSAAARELSLTQPAVSQQVAALEKEVGTRLLDRGGAGGVVVTEAGALLLRHADALAATLALADAQMAELGVASEPLRVGAFPSALAVLVPRAIAALDHVRVQATESRLADLRAGVASGALHVGVGFQDYDAPREDEPGLVRHELMKERFVVAVAPGHRLARRRTVRLEELAGETWAAPSTTGLVARACRDAGFEPDIAYVSRDPLVIRALVVKRLAVSLTPALLAGELPGVRVLEVRDAPPKRAVFALTPKVGARADALAFVSALRP